MPPSGDTASNNAESPFVPADSARRLRRNRYERCVIACRQSERGFARRAGPRTSGRAHAEKVVPSPAASANSVAHDRNFISDVGDRVLGEGEIGVHGEGGSKITPITPPLNTVRLRVRTTGTDPFYARSSLGSGCWRAALAEHARASTLALVGSAKARHPGEWPGPPPLHAVGLDSGPGSPDHPRTIEATLGVDPTAPMVLP